MEGETYEHVCAQRKNTETGTDNEELGPTLGMEHRRVVQKGTGCHRDASSSNTSVGRQNPLVNSTPRVIRQAGKHGETGAPSCARSGGKPAAAQGAKHCQRDTAAEDIRAGTRRRRRERPRQARWRGRTQAPTRRANAGGERTATSPRETKRGSGPDKDKTTLEMTSRCFEREVGSDREIAEVRAADAAGPRDAARGGGEQLLSQLLERIARRHWARSHSPLQEARKPAARPPSTPLPRVHENGPVPLAPVARRCRARKRDRAGHLGGLAREKPAGGERLLEGARVQNASLSSDRENSTWAPMTAA